MGQLRPALRALILVAIAAGCRARPTYEYGETITTTSSDEPVAPAAGTSAPAASVTTTTAPARPSVWRHGERQ